jgi:hypothetical protein
MPLLSEFAEEAFVISKFVLTGLLSVVSSVSLAAVNLGSYTGRTENGQECSVEISKEAQTYNLKVSWTAQDAESVACAFKARNSKETTQELRVSGEHETAVCKVKVALANDGTPVEAQIGIGRYFQFGFDVTCSNLQKNQ